MPYWLIGATSNTIATSARMSESLVRQVSAWLPVVWTVVALLAIYLLWRAGLFRRLIDRLTRVAGFGIEFRFDDASARETRTTIEGELQSVMRTIQREIEAFVRSKGLQSCLKTTLRSSSLNRASDYRATVHIADPLYRDYLYQLLDYYPSGKGHGRRFSVRAGLIGVVWRTQSWEPWNETTISQSELVRQWGMTDREAAARNVVGKVRSMIALPIFDRVGSRPLGVLYLDSEKEKRFGSTPTEEERLVEELSALLKRHLAGPLEEVVQIAAERSPQLVLEPDF